MARSNISIPFDRDVPVLGMVPDQNKPLSVLSSYLPVKILNLLFFDTSF